MPTNPLSKYLACACLLAAPLAWGVNLGTVGTTFPIAEPDIRAVILGQLANKDLDKIAKNMQEGTRSYTAKLSPYHLPEPNQTRTRFVDVALQLKDDFYIPSMDEQGNLVWKIVAHKGERVSPLAQIRPTTAFLVVDGTSKEQAAFLAEAHAALPRYLVPLVTAGDPAALAKKMQVPVFRASPFILRRFQITHVPALIRPGYGQHYDMIAVTELARPWSLDALRAHDPLRATSIAEAKEFSYAP